MPHVRAEWVARVRRSTLTISWPADATRVGVVVHCDFALAGKTRVGLVSAGIGLVDLSAACLPAWSGVEWDGLRFFVLGIVSPGGDSPFPTSVKEVRRCRCEEVKWLWLCINQGRSGSHGKAA